ncbi:hypothetical protein DZF91_09445 [Actinomadura logoneensis]|uniref:Uncharacterized protein n=1 Tax=Actinomadura logoneensis TaxID=2293572 RepID=A0A372JPI0_9ACTN|nr:hypothetical protein [Actinomadura logoneensis]RFU41869.1 hypothetical protein DZF91_09445 [Actinomadura logoneensis]
MAGGSRTASVRLSVAMMHHPRRAGRLPAVLASFEPLRPRVVPDPDPLGPPSPLRTAKRAWAEIEDGATHHLVLQDDAVPTPDFARHLHEAVTALPAHGIAMYSHWDSPHNSYLTRRAAVADRAYAPLSSTEWTPTQGFVLPVDLARRLAAFLADMPDEAQDDDEMVVIFCREQGIPVVATVPHLLDHGHETTIVGHHGRLHATVHTPGMPIRDGHWRRREGLEPGPYTVELLDSLCAVRIVHGEPVEHRYGWYWYDACSSIGPDPEEVLDRAEPWLSAVPSDQVPVAVEVWAAGYLLGADVAHASALAPPPTCGGPLTRPAVSSWVESGLAEPDRTAFALDPLIDLGVAAVRCALAAHGGAHVR